MDADTTTATEAAARGIGRAVLLSVAAAAVGTVVSMIAAVAGWPHAEGLMNAVVVFAAVSMCAAVMWVVMGHGPDGDA